MEQSRRDKDELLVPEWGYVIDLCRERGMDDFADELQFGKEGHDRFDGHRCRICDHLAGGNREHRCWSWWWRFRNMRWLKKEKP